jgi:hypothetical protein
MADSQNSQNNLNSTAFSTLSLETPRDLLEGTPTVFFSWQSDIPAVRNKMKTVIERAVNKLSLSYDEATRGEPGAVDIVATIFRKIAKCSVFIADVSIINNQDPVSINKEDRFISFNKVKEKLQIQMF